MRVFVLNTGRCGSMTFAKACSHITNYTSGHETRAGLIGWERLKYPDRHIEVDNRLAWFLGRLRDKRDDLFVHLWRDPELVAKSYNKRWGKGGIIQAFASGITMGHGDYSEEEKLELCRWYVTTVNYNIATYLTGKRIDWDGGTYSTTPLCIDINNPRARFFELWNAIGAEGDLDAALDEFDICYNAS